jgi:hypothetical protein
MTGAYIENESPRLNVNKSEDSIEHYHIKQLGEVDLEKN